MAGLGSSDEPTQGSLVLKNSLAVCVNYSSIIYNSLKPVSVLIGFYYKWRIIQTWTQ